MGAYWYIAPKIKSSLKQGKKTPNLFYAGRPEKSSPATGAPSVHKEEQDNIIKSCFNLNS